MPERVVKAAYSDSTVRVYQAYCPEIAMPALEAGRFVPPFAIGRMTWIKPSFNWMMYRSGFATKPGQEIVLGIDITREGFEWALEHAVLSSFTPTVQASTEAWQRLLKEMPVRIQWDPERDSRLNLVKGLRTIQIGLSGDAVRRYVTQWIVRIEDMTRVAHRMAAELARGVNIEDSPDKFETPYPLDAALRRKICLE